MPWFELIRQQVVQQSDETGLLPALTSVKAKVNTLTVTDEISFEQVQLQLKPEANSWIVDINSTQTKGQLTLAKDLMAQGIRGQSGVSEIIPL